MAENILEKQTCRACGVDVRPNTAFCYNCGSSITGESGGDAESGQTAPSPGDVVTERSKVTSSLDREPGAVEMPKTSLDVGSDRQGAQPFPKAAKDAGAIAGSRRRAKSEPKKWSEATWEEHENAPNVWFLLMAFILTLFAVGILFAMLYIR